jgi:hypothetical protein
MSGLLRRLTRRRAATADETQPTTPESSEPAAAPAETPADAAGDQPVAAPAESEQPTRLIPATGEQPAGEAKEATGEPAGGDDAAMPGDSATPGDPAAPAGGVAAGTQAEGTEQTAATAPARDLPAGVDPGELELAPLPSARRGKLRRRLRYLRRVRELLLRDLGGFSYELQRTAGGVVRESHRRLSEAKTGRIAAIDAEIRTLEARLGEPHAEPVLREPGIGGTCPECGELHSSDARYCSHCGAPLDARARAEREAAIRAAAQPTTGAHPTPEPQPASVLWAAGPRPQASAADKPEEDHTATSEWLAAQAKPAEPASPEQAGGAGVPASAEPPAVESPAHGEAPTVESPAPGEPPAGEPKAGDDTAAAGDEPAAAAGDETPRPGDDKGAGDETARGEEAGGSGASEDETRDMGAVADDTGPNGRRQEDVPPPLRSGDRLGGRSERPS